MNIWVVTVGEPVPLTEKQTARLHRTGQFAMWAATQAKVTWWTSGFDHFTKKFVSERDSDVSLSNGLLLKLFRGCGYDNNISVRRFLDQNILAKKILKEMLLKPDKPDVILCSIPPVELAAAAMQYGEKNHVPVVLDMRDMWPDIFVDHAPALLRPLVRLGLTPLFLQAHRAFEKAAGIIGITESFVDWGLRRAARHRTLCDKAFPFAYNSVHPSPESLASADAFWDSRGIHKEDRVFTVCFFGSISRQFDFNTVFKAFRDKSVANKARLVVCGTGDKLGQVRNLALGMKNVEFAGWVDAPKIYSLMRRSQAGLDPLLDRYDFLASINNKAVEYLSAGLPVISSPRKGELFGLLQGNGCGVSFDFGDSAGLASVLVDLSDNSGKVNAMSAAALKCFRERFTLNKINEDILQHLNLVIRAYDKPIDSQGKMAAKSLFYAD